MLIHILIAVAVTLLSSYFIIGILFGCVILIFEGDNIVTALYKTYPDTHISAPIYKIATFIIVALIFPALLYKVIKDRLTDD